MDYYRIINVGESNWREVCDLKVHTEQESFIETNIESLVEAAYDKKHRWAPFALYFKEELIGFAMIGAYNEIDKYIWLDRFMVDIKFQGKGHSKPLLKKLIHFIEEKWTVTDIVLSIEPTNTKAIEIYKQIGFKFNGMIDPNNKEKLMEYAC